MSRHREGGVRPRYGRISVATLSSSLTMVAVLGGVGLLPSQPQASASSVSVPTASPDADETRTADSTPSRSGFTPADRAEAVGAARAAALPSGSGSGYRVVYSEGRQRVWLVDRGNEVRRTYPVSGSIYDNLDPGTYSVYSRSEQAWGIDDSGTMRWFVRFAQGDRAAIGFHDIPVDDGEKVQTLDQLGTPLSHGCIRQRPVDAKALWDFAPIGTKVVVTA